MGLRIEYTVREMTRWEAFKMRWGWTALRLRLSRLWRK